MLTYNNEKDRWVIKRSMNYNFYVCLLKGHTYLNKLQVCLSMCDLLVDNDKILLSFSSNVCLVLDLINLCGKISFGILLYYKNTAEVTGQYLEDFWGFWRYASHWFYKVVSLVKSLILKSSSFTNGKPPY